MAELCVGTKDHAWVAASRSEIGRTTILLCSCGKTWEIPDELMEELLLAVTDPHE